MTSKGAILELDRLQKYISGLHACILNGEITMNKMLQACEDGNLEQCRNIGDDDRKMSGCERLGASYYMYQNTPIGTSRRTTLYIGTREALVKHDWGEAITAYANDTPYNDKNDDWNTLAAPTRS